MFSVKFNCGIIIALFIRYINFAERICNMLQVERYKMIESMLDQKGMMGISDIVEALRVSRATAYRDLKDLSKLGKIELVRGGAAKVKYSMTYDRPYTEMRNQNTVEKGRIADEACEFVKPDMTVFLDSSTTVLLMCEKLCSIPRLQIITNDVKIATEFHAAPNITVYVTGGMIRKGYHTLTSFMNNKFLDGMMADAVFLSCDAINIENGGMVTNSEEVYIKQAMLNISNKRYFLCDHTKFNTTAFISFSKLNIADKIITGVELSDEIYFQYLDANLPIERV